jgi:ligand-binding sensor protein
MKKNEVKQLMNLKNFIDIEKLQKIQNEFSTATGIASVTVDCIGKPVTKSSNFTRYCDLIRSDSKRKKVCYKCDAHGGLQAAIKGGPYFYTCHGGLTDFAIPIIVNDTYLGAVLAGQIRLEDEVEELDNIVIPSPDLLDNPILKEAYLETPILSFEQVQAAAEMIFAVTNYIVERQFVNIIQERLNDKNMKLLESITVQSELERSLKEAELKALQSQINPHFLFNVLNTIGRLALMENAKKTENIIYSFSDMMRYTLKKNSTQLVNLSSEIDHVSNYLSIQKLRLGERLNYNIDVPEDLRGIKCPFMILQPIVENSINHAIEDNIEGGSINISASKEESNLIISISDDGIGIAEEKVEEILTGKHYDKNNDSGIGLYNVNMRLIHHYGSERGLEIKSGKNNGTQVYIYISTDNIDVSNQGDES